MSYYLFAIISVAFVSYFGVQKAIMYVMDIRKDINRLLDAELFPKCAKHNYEKVETIGTFGTVKTVYRCVECGRLTAFESTVECSHSWSDYVVVSGTEEGRGPKIKEKVCTKCGKTVRVETNCAHVWKTELISGVVEGAHTMRITCTECGYSDTKSYSCLHSKTVTHTLEVPPSALACVEASERLSKVMGAPRDFRYSANEFITVKKLVTLCALCGTQINVTTIENKTGG